MKKANRILAFLLCMAVLLGLLPLTAPTAAAYSGTCGDNLTWLVDISTRTLIISGSGAMYDYGYDYYEGSNAPWASCQSSFTSVQISDGVTTVGRCAFVQYDSLKSVTIGDSVTTIGDDAFCFCEKLTSVTIGDSVITIGHSAFSNCTALKSVTIGDSVMTIDHSAFSWCTSLTSVTIPDSVKTIDEYAFSDCTSLTSVTIPDSVTTIAGNAFSDCTALKSVTIGNSVTTIGDEAFKNCTALMSVTIGNSVTTIGDEPFSDCTSLTGIWVDEENPSYSSDAYGVLFNKDKTTLIQCPGAYSGDYTIPNSVATIGNSAFWRCTGLTSIAIPDSVTTIGDHAFYRCESLTNAPIPDSVTIIDSGAFDFCESLTSVTIPDSVTTISDYAFYCCHSLTDLTIGNNVTSIGKSAFYYCDALTSVTIPASVKSIGFYAFHDCDSLTSVMILNPNCRIYDSSTTFGDLNGSNGITTIYGDPGSTAQAYAEKYGYAFRYLPCDAHNLSYVPAAEPTCSATGNIAHWYCTTCCCCFSDAEATQQIDPVIPAAPHSFDANGTCTVCGYAGQFVVEMTDRDCDSWNGNKILVYEDDVLIGELTIASGASATEIINYYSDREYRFVWKKGSYASECSFKILLNDAVLYEISGAGSLSNEKTFLTIDAVPRLDENLRFDMNISAGAEMVVNYSFVASAVSKYTDFYLEVSKNVADGDPIVTTYGITDEHTAIDVMNDPATSEPLLYNVAYTGINAKEMGDEFATTLYAIDENGKVYKGETVVSSIKEFLLGKLEDEESTPELKTMAVDMLKYGAAAQINFGYDTENLVTNALTEEQLALGTQEIPEAVDCATVTGEGANVSTSITVKSKVELTLSCISADQADPTAVKCIIKDAEGKVLAELPTENIGNVMYKATYSDVGAKEMRKVIIATFYGSDGNVISKTVNWSVESYVAQTRASDEAIENNIAIVNAMLTYGDSVAAYLTAIGQ